MHPLTLNIASEETTEARVFHLIENFGNAFCIEDRKSVV